MKAARLAHGFTLLELLVVIAIVGVMASIASWANSKLMRAWQLKRSGHQLYEDLKTVQSRAERSGSMTISGGALVSQRVFLVFDQNARSYATFDWQDHNGNGIAETGESVMVQETALPRGVAFDWASDVNRRACSNANNPPASAISFASPNTPPCNNRPCIKFDHNGFSVMGPGAIYLSDGENSLAITATRPGHFTMCEWNGERWR